MTSHMNTAKTYKKLFQWSIIFFAISIIFLQFLFSEFFAKLCQLAIEKKFGIACLLCFLNIHMHRNFRYFLYIDKNNYYTYQWPL